MTERTMHDNTEGDRMDRAMVSEFGKRGADIIEAAGTLRSAYWHFASADRMVVVNPNGYDEGVLNKWRNERTACAEAVEKAIEELGSLTAGEET